MTLSNSLHRVEWAKWRVFGSVKADGMYSNRRTLKGLYVTSAFLNEPHRMFMVFQLFGKLAVSIFRVNIWRRGIRRPIEMKCSWTKQ